MSKYIICPDCNMGKEERIEKIFLNLEEWMRSDEMMSLVKLFGGNVQELKKEKYLGRYIKKLKDFSKVWDMRNGGSIERMYLENSKFVSENEAEIMKNIRELGFIGKTKLDDCKTPINYILPLGGARYTCLHRPQMSKKIIEKYNVKDVTVVGLTGMRKLGEKDKEAAITYPNGAGAAALNEYELMCAGFEQTFDVENYNEEIKHNQNENLKEAKRKYLTDKNDVKGIFVLAAPSKDPEKRRANTVDTYEYFFEEFACAKGDKVVLVTSQIYVGVQLLQFIRFAIEKEIDVECIGVDDEIGGPGLSKAVNYLQEINGTLNRIDELYEIYGEKNYYEY